MTTTGTRTDVNKLVDSEFLGQHDLQKPDGSYVEPTLIIESVSRFEPEKRKRKRMPDGSYKDEAVKRVAIRFKGKRKAWLSGPTTRKTIIGLYGKYIEDWIGKAITLYVDPDVEMGRDKVGGIRVRPHAPRGPASTEPLDNPPDEAKRKQIEEALARDERQPGDD